MKRILSLVMVLTFSLTLCVLLLAQEEQPEDPTEPGAKQAQPEKEDPAGQEQEQDEPSEISKLIGQLSSDSSAARELAIQALVKMGEDALPELNKLLGVGLFEKPAELSDELKERIEKLIKELDSDEWPVREAATKELGEIGEPAEAYLRRVAEFGTPEAKTRAEKLLAKLEEKKRGGKTEEDVQQARFNAKLSAVRILGQIATKACNTGLLAALGDKDKMVNTTALLHLRKNSGWSLGFGPGDLEKKRKTVVEKWEGYLENPVRPASEESFDFKSVLDAGDSLKTSAQWNLQSTSTMSSMTTSIVVGPNQQRKREQKKRTTTYVNEASQEQKFTDIVKEAGTGTLRFTRTYHSHKTGSSSFVERSGTRLGPGSRVPLTATQLSGSELEFLCRPGFCDIKVLKGNVTLAQREKLSGATAGLDLLLPGKAVRPGDSWQVPELAALKLLRSLGPSGGKTLDVSSVKFTCKLLEVADKDGKKLARISVVANFGPAQQESQVNVAGAVIRMSTSYGYSSLMSLANSTIIGDCTFDLDSGTVTKFSLFGPLLHSEPPDPRLGNRNREQSSFGYFKLDVTGSKKKSEK